MKNLKEIKRFNNEKVSEEQLNQLLESEFVVDYDYMTSGQWIDYMIYTLFLEDGEEVEVYYKHKGWIKKEWISIVANKYNTIKEC